MEHGSVYILTAYTPDIREEFDGVESYNIDENHNVNVLSEQIGVFNSVETAEQVIKNLIDFRKKSDWFYELTDYCAFILTEHELNVGLDACGNPPGYESVRSYLGNGELNCFSDYDDRCKKPFIGRDDVSKYVNEGDYAFYMRSGKLVPILVEKLAFTTTQWKEKFAEGVAGDVTDDSGLAFVAGYGHEHPFSPYVFPLSILPQYTISEELKTKLQNEKIRYMNGEL